MDWGFVAYAVGVPWKAEDAEVYRPGLTPYQRRKWAQTANAVLEETGDDATAIKVANSRVRSPNRGAKRTQRGSR